MPALPNPLLLADFLTSCLDQGGMLGILALNGIFTLVTKHGLEYSAFYARLYALLQVTTDRHLSAFAFSEGTALDALSLSSCSNNVNHLLLHTQLLVY